MGDYLKRSYDAQDKIQNEFTMKPEIWLLFGILPILKIKKTVTPTSINSYYYLFCVLPLFSVEKEYETKAANA